VPHRVAQQILHRPPDQFAVTVERARLARAPGDTRFAFGDLVIDHFHQVREQFAQVEILVQAGRRLGRFAQQAQHVIDQRFQPLALQSDPFDFRFDVAGALFARDFQRHAEAGQRRTEFMADVLQQTLVGHLHGFQAGGHGIEIRRQLTDLVLPDGDAGADPRGQVSCGDLAAGASQRLERRRQRARQEEADERTEQRGRCNAQCRALGSGRQYRARRRPADGIHREGDARPALEHGHGHRRTARSQLLQRGVAAQHLAPLLVDHVDVAPRHTGDIQQFVTQTSPAVHLQGLLGALGNAEQPAFETVDGLLGPLLPRQLVVEPTDGGRKPDDAEPHRQKDFPEQGMHAGRPGEDPPQEILYW
jgi:hypothetical protein